jgi:hypothetical protein
MTDLQTKAAARQIYCVLSARSLPYAAPCLASLARNAIETLSITLITDEVADGEALKQAVAQIADRDRHGWRVLIKADVDTIADEKLAAFPHVHAFRNGHPCWRKITDPALVAADGEEIIILDPDVYFPNTFAFEATASNGIALMWQRPNCLLPEDTVRAAFEQGIAMADHTDIGVAQFRQMLDWGHLDRLIERLGGEALPWSMHVESIVWAELAQSMGGAHLNPTAWRCFDNSVVTRMKIKLGVPGASIFASLDLDKMKCLHAGGVAKNWIAKAEEDGVLAPKSRLDQPTVPKPYVAFSRSKFERKFQVRRWAARLGLYRLLNGE